MAQTAELFRPTSIDRLAEMLRTASDDGRSVGIRGAGSKETWGGVGAPVDAVLSTRGLDRIVEHAAGDLVITVEAGVALADVQRTVAAAGQWLALDPPEPGATVGGVVATAASGPRRLRYGTPRDLLIGITVVLADGTVAKSGGKVVKNVAGYDLGKLFTGSFGTLGVIAECTFRLHPRQPALRAVSTPTHDPAERFAEVLATGGEPAAAEWDGTTLTTVFESIEAAADEQAERAILAIGGQLSDAVPPGFGARPWDATSVGLKVTHRLGATSDAIAAVRSATPNARLRVAAGSGVVLAGVGADDLGALDSLRKSIAALDGQVVVASAPEEAKRDVDVWGPVRGLPVMQRIKEQFDPDGRMCPGRFVVQP
ncbi:MAG TPA: FAD-binding oxidoreductase [Mycobacteriales bacterium]|nr:FAD-binding oxidoreductase [Mycobacteriales bacterium]